MYDVPMKTIDQKIDAVLALVDMQKRKHDQVKKYSGGMRRRMELARGLLHEPRILFLDEPTLGLDPQTRDHLWAYITTLAKKMHMTIILTTHYMEEAEQLCDRIAIIDDGRIVALDTPARLKRAVKGDLVTLTGVHASLSAMKTLSFVKDAEVEGSTARLSVENASTNLPRLLQALGPIDSVEVHSPDLNDVFLHYTGRAIREDAPGSVERLRTLTSVRRAK
jgi:ABC-2 type transport system ATP-binding protein